jgi:hypothetical protein
LSKRALFGAMFYFFYRMMEYNTPSFFLSRKVVLPAITPCGKREKLPDVINV